MFNYCIIPARRNSQRIKNKNSKIFCGKPIICWPIIAAKKSKKFDKIFVFTNDPLVEKIFIKDNKVVVLKRSEKLSKHSTPILASINEAIKMINKKYPKPDNVCYILATAALINEIDIKKSYNSFVHSNKNFCFSITNYHYPIQRAIALKKNRIKLWKPKYRNSRSQDLVEMYHDAGQFYWGKTNAFIKNKNMFSNETVPYQIPSYRAMDIDTKADWKYDTLKFKILKKL